MIANPFEDTQSTHYTRNMSRPIQGTADAKLQRPVVAGVHMWDRMSSDKVKPPTGRRLSWADEHSEPTTTNRGKYADVESEKLIRPHIHNQGENKNAILVY